MSQKEKKVEGEKAFLENEMTLKFSTTFHVCIHVYGNTLKSSHTLLKMFLQQLEAPWREGCDLCHPQSSNQLW